MKPLTICNCLFNANIGDKLSLPFNYFDFPQRMLCTDAGNYGGGDVIFGGGGMLHTVYAEIMERASLQEGAVKIAWGIGINGHGETEVVYPEWLNRFQLVGLRDYKNPYQYVPCPSCLNAAFDLPRPAPVHEIVIYEHNWFPVRIGEMATLPRMCNTDVGNACGLPKVLSFLASGQTVFTTSFHGVYWSLLLGRAVVCYQPWSNKFRGFRFAPKFCDQPDDWKEACRVAVPAPAHYLAECRQRNRDFAKQVFELLQKPT